MRVVAALVFISAVVGVAGFLGAQSGDSASNSKSAREGPSVVYVDCGHDPSCLEKVFARQQNEIDACRSDPSCDLSKLGNGPISEAELRELIPEIGDCLEIRHSPNGAITAKPCKRR